MGFGLGSRSWWSGEGCSLMHESFRGDGCRSLPGMTLAFAVAVGPSLLGSGSCAGSGSGADAGAGAGCSDSGSGSTAGACGSGEPAKTLPEDASSRAGAGAGAGVGAVEFSVSGEDERDEACWEFWAF